MNKPTATELAMIAATLAHGRPVEGLAMEAFHLWQRCNLLLDPPTVAPTPKPRFEKPKSFPVKLPEMLLLYLPNIPEADRWRDYRSYLVCVNSDIPRRNEVLKSWPEMVVEQFDVAKKMQHQTEQGVSEQWFEINGNSFLDWRDKKTSKARSVAAKSKREEKKSLRKQKAA